MSWVFGTWNNATVTLPYVFMTIVPALKYALLTHTSSHNMERSTATVIWFPLKILEHVYLVNLKLKKKNLWFSYMTQIVCLTYFLSEYLEYLEILTFLTQRDILL